MTRYAYAPQGAIVAFFTDIPDGAQLGVDALDPATAEVTHPCGPDAEVGWLWDVKSKAFTAPPPLTLTAAELEALKDSLKVAVDARAEAYRQKLITPGSGQAMEYQEAQSEASRALSALAADPGATLSAGDYPMLAASVGYSLDPGPGANTGRPTADIAGEARAVDAARKAWLQAGAAIRDVRLRGKDAIDAAASAAGAEAAFAAVTWPTLI